MRTLTKPLNRLACWFHSRRRPWGVFTFDLGDLSIDEDEIYLDLAAGRD